jgi:hypothetical protein
MKTTTQADTSKVSDILAQEGFSKYTTLHYVDVLCLVLATQLQFAAVHKNQFH